MYRAIFLGTFPECPQFPEGSMLGPDSAADKPIAGEQKPAEVRKKGKNRSLAKTLDATLQPHVPPGKPGRPKGARNYGWSPEMDNQLVGLWQKYGPAKAKAVMGKRLLECCPRDTMPKQDSVRNAVERRMASLGLPTANPRKGPESKPQPGPEPNAASESTEIPNAAKQVTSGIWTPVEITALLGALGGDLTNESIIDRTHHSLKAVHAKLRRLGYAASELRSIAFTIEELAHMLQVTVREVQRWRRSGWLPSTRHRITDGNLVVFLKNHHQVIGFAKLPSYVRAFLLSLGYPAPEARNFHAAVKSILESITGRKRRCSTPQTDGSNSSPTVDESASSMPISSTRVAGKISRWSELKKQRIAPQRAVYTPGLSVAAAV
jgi:hypothetical protein